MSVRIHQLSKDIGMENKELIALLKSRGYEVKSASSTVDNISAEALREEFAAQAPQAQPVEAESVTEAPVAPKLPEGAFVKSAADIEREHQEKSDTKETEKATKAPKQVNPATPASTAIPPKAPEAARAADAEQTPAAESIESEGPEAPESEAGNLKKIHVKPPIVVRDFAGEIGLKPFKLISELMEMGIFASMNQTIEESVAVQVAGRHGCELEIHHRGEQAEKSGSKPKVEKLDDDDPKFLKPRPPVVCILGHVDHGKTTLLDTIREANVVKGEAGGITQHIGAYQIDHKGQKISFIDTPGHAAFSMMRARGANVTDVSILVIAADDAFKPQTEEALKFAKEANNSIIVAINKIDSKGANIDRVKQQMQEKGIAPEDWGGETIAVEVSALKGTNIDNLLDMILLQVELLELKANPTCPASGTIIESQIEMGRGASATVIVERGTLKKGDALLCGEVYCRVKTMADADGKQLKDAPPATPVKVTGWSDVPASGTKFSTQKNEKVAKRCAEENIKVRKLNDAASTQQHNTEGGAATVEDLFAAIENQQKKCLRVIVKSDVHGSTEALAQALKAIESDKVELDVMSKGVGHITKNDITLASAGGAIVVGFNVKLDNGVQSLAKHHNIRIVQHAIIYELIEQVEEAMADMLDAEYTEKKTGAAEVRHIFTVGKARKVAGCMVTEGLIQRNCIARLMRGGELIYESKIDTLKRFKDDVKEVRAGYECGINVAGYDDYQEGDMIECFAVEEQRASL